RPHCDSRCTRCSHSCGLRVQHLCEPPEQDGGSRGRFRIRGDRLDGERGKIVSLRRGHARAELNAEINVVSLIDVMMLLLVIFMITAAMMAGGVEVALPQADGAPLESKRSTVVTIAADRVYVDETALTDAQFRTRFRALLGDRPKDGVYVQAQRDITIQ